MRVFVDGVEVEWVHWEVKICYKYPDSYGCWIKDIVSLPIHLSGQPEWKKPCWLWDGNREAPTLSPSINVIDRWHGYLKAGKLENA